MKYLGVYLDDLLSWQSHFDMLYIKLRKANGLISVLTNSAPQALINIYSLNQYSDSHNTRGYALGLLVRPVKRTKTYGLNSIVYQSVVQWNKFQLRFPNSDISIMSIPKISKLYKSIIFNTY